MFDVSDASRARALRVQQQHQYAEELRKQIEVKNQKKNTPDIYTTTNESYFTAPIRQNTVSPTRLSDYSEPQYEATRRSSSSISRSSKIYHNNYPTYKMPSYSAQISRKTFNPMEFNERLSEIREIMDQQKQLAETNESIYSAIQQQQLPQISDDIIGIRTIIAELPSEFSQDCRKTMNKYKTLRKFMDEITIPREVQELREDFLSLNHQISTFQSKMEQISDTSKTSLTAIKTEQARFQNQQNVANQKIVELNSKDLHISEEVLIQNKDFEMIDDKTTKKFSTLQNEIDKLIEDVANHLADEIIVESDKNKEAITTLSSQAAEVNTSATHSFSLLKKSIPELQNVTTETMNSFFKSMNEAFSTADDETNDFLNDIFNRFNHLCDDSSENFEVIQKELVTTMSTLRKNINESINSLEETLHKEAYSRKKNAMEVITKYTHFQDFIQKELKIQENKLYELCEEVEKKGKEQFDKAFKPYNYEFEPIRIRMDAIDILENKINGFEEKLEHMNTDIKKEIEDKKREMKELSSQFYSIRSKANSKFSAITRKVEGLERKQKSGATLEDMKKKQEDYIAISDNRIKKAEAKLKEIMILKVKYDEKKEKERRKALKNKEKEEKRLKSIEANQVKLLAIVSGQKGDKNIIEDESYNESDDEDFLTDFTESETEEEEEEDSKEKEEEEIKEKKKEEAEPLISPDFISDEEEEEEDDEDFDGNYIKSINTTVYNSVNGFKDEAIPEKKEKKKEKEEPAKVIDEPIVDDFDNFDDFENDDEKEEEEKKEKKKKKKHHKEEEDKPEKEEEEKKEKKKKKKHHKEEEDKPEQKEEEPEKTPKKEKEEDIVDLDDDDLNDFVLSDTPPDAFEFGSQEPSPKEKDKKKKKKNKMQVDRT